MTSFLDILLRLAPFGTTIVGIFALLYARQQIKINRENEAKRQFISFLDECIKYPLLAGNRRGDPVVIDVSNHEDEVRYHWFLSKLLMASESILEIAKNDPAWSNTVRENMKAHLFYIRDGNVRLGSYSKDLQSLVLEEISKLEPRDQDRSDHGQVSKS